MAFSLPPLPYATGALAATGMCQETLDSITASTTTPMSPR